VHHAEPLPSAAIAWAEHQFGVLTRAQLISFGLHDSQVARLVHRQVLQRIDRGIYILGLLEPSWHHYAWGAVLLGGRSARLIGASAAVFYGLADPRLPIQLGVDSTSGLASRQWLTVFRQRAEARPSRFLASPPRTLVEDTVLDPLLGCSRIALVNPPPSSSLAEEKRLRSLLLRAAARDCRRSQLARTNPRALQRAPCGRPFLAGLAEARSMLAGRTNPALAGSGVGCGLARPHATSRTQSGAASWPSPHMSKNHSFFGPPPFRVPLTYARKEVGSTDFAQCGRGPQRTRAMKHR